MSIIPIALYRLDRMEMTPPPAELFEDLLGYAGDMRLVGFNYQYGKLYYTDGRTGGTGNWSPWLVWHRHLDLETRKNYCFGFDDQESEHMLVLDREARKFYVGRVQEARQVLDQQFPCVQETEPLVLSTEDLERLALEYFENLPKLSAEDLLKQQIKLKEGVVKLEVWLESR